MTVYLYNLSNKPVKGLAFSFSFGLFSQADTKLLKVAPTMAAGDFTLYGDGVEIGNVTDLPIHVSKGLLRLTITALQNNYDDVAIVCHDAAGAEWCDAIITYSTVQAVAVGTSDLAAGAQMDLVDAPNATAITAIQDGLAVPGDAMDLIDNAVDAGAVKTDAVTKIQSGLATSANQTTIINRIGAWTGTGVNTILGAFKALLSKVATVPSDIGDTFTPTTDSTEAIRDKLDAGVNIVYTAKQLEDAVEGIILTAYRDSSYEVTLTDLGDISSRDKLFFTVKKKLSDDDAEAVIQIEETDGLLYLNQAAIEAPIVDSDGSITVIDEVAGDVTIHIKAAAMALLSIGNDMPYDVATIEDDDKYPKTISTFNILGTATRTIE